MQYNLKDSVGTLASVANMWTAGTFPTLLVTGGTLTSATINLTRSDSVGIVFLGTTTTGTAQAFTATIGTPGLITTGTVTNGFALGQVGQVTTTGTLPAPLATGTNYFVVPVTGSTFNLATSYANAVAGTLITLTTAGVATNTFTPTAFAGSVVIQLQSSNDNTNWIAEGTNGTLTAGTALGLGVDRPKYHFLRVSVTGVTAGQVTLNSQVVTKSDSYQ